LRPSARLQAAIDLLDEIIIAARDGGASADNIARKFFKARRYAGSKDRRAVREHVYAVIRRFGERPESGRAAMVGLAAEQTELAALFDGSDYGPAAITPEEPAAKGANIPTWLGGKFAQPIGVDEKAALFDRAPLDLRLNRQKASDQDMREVWPEIESLSLPNAYRLPSGTRVEDSKAYREGWVEIQDMGSQAIVASGYGQSGDCCCCR